VREDEEPITVVPKLTPLSVVLTLDTSGSMKKRLADAQTAAKSFLDTLEAQEKGR
jgi:Mg-chelatase subunit ChlD